MTLARISRIALIATLSLSISMAVGASQWRVRPEWVAAHEAFLAGDALQGRGSATRDEAIAAAYVSSQFQAYGLKTAPGMDGYLQSATIVGERLAAQPIVTLNGEGSLGATLLLGGPASGGSPILFGGDDPNAIPSGAVVVVTGKPRLRALFAAARSKHVGILVLPATSSTIALFAANGGATLMPTALEGEPPRFHTNVVTLPAEDFKTLVTQPGSVLSISYPKIQPERTVTTNAIGFLPGRDAAAGVLLLSAHLDHLGIRNDGAIMHGANDDASGTTAVLELAHAIASGRQPRRGILFVCYGSEETGQYGSRYFGTHSPIPLDRFVANLELEMIGARDPQRPGETLMMTGFDKSTLGAALKSHGAPVGPDPYPDEHFFERSDNYPLALKGIVAHTLSAWPLTPTYHEPSDTVANLDLPYAARTIQSLIPAIEWLANDRFRPVWKTGGKPAE